MIQMKVSAKGSRLPSEAGLLKISGHVSKNTLAISRLRLSQANKTSYKKILADDSSPVKISGLLAFFILAFFVFREKMDKKKLSS
jgi:hypothetical protein